MCEQKGQDRCDQRATPEPNEQIEAPAIHYQVDLPQGKLYTHISCFLVWFSESRRLGRS